jgi:hypothetical protein
MPFIYAWCLHLQSACTSSMCIFFQWCRGSRDIREIIEGDLLDTRMRAEVEGLTY